LAGEKFNRLAPGAQTSIGQPLELLATVGFVDLVELLRLGIEIKQFPWPSSKLPASSLSMWSLIDRQSMVTS
jgi:hypothetical protein